jgi:hypothetical protein
VPPKRKRLNVTALRDGRKDRNPEVCRKVLNFSEKAPANFPAGIDRCWQNAEHVDMRTTIRCVAKECEHIPEGDHRQEFGLSRHDEGVGTLESFHGGSDIRWCVD